MNFTDHKQHRQALESFFNYLQINYAMDSDPILLSKILSDTMHLSDFPLIKQRLQHKITKPQSLTNFLIQIRESFIENHPAICVFLQQAMDEHLLPPVINPDSINRFIHYCYLLELITSEIINDHGFTVAITKHLQQKRNRNIGNNLLHQIYHVGIFNALKIRTIAKSTAALNYYRQKHTPIPTSYLIYANILLWINILEATITDLAHGFFDNFIVGMRLTFAYFKKLNFLPGSRELVYHISPKWTQLYHTWNMAFIIGKLADKFEIVCPKLIIPCVASKTGDRYMFPRIRALDLTTNIYALNKDNPNLKTLANHRVLAKKFGKINKRYMKFF